MLCVVDDHLGDARRDAMGGVGESSAERKQIALQRVCDLAQLGIEPGRGGEADRRLKLVDLAVGDNARVGFRNARAVEQAGLAGVACFCVDFHGVKYRRAAATRCAGDEEDHQPPLPTKPKTTAPPDSRARQRFRRHLLAWYRKNGRDLPWRKTDDPYHILVSEIMLQQTQVERVLPKYGEWLEKYPSFEALADAPVDEVTATWYPLGYNIRPRRLHSIAREAVERFGGELPSDEATLRSFKGIGEYTAGAIRSFAFRERAAILDTNVARVLLRVFIGKGQRQVARG